MIAICARNCGKSLFFLLFLMYCGASQAAAGVAENQADMANWSHVGGDYREQFFSPLQGINRDNVDELGVAWSFDIDMNRGQEMSPLVIDGIMYVALAWNKVMALDAVSGRLLWQFDPKVNPSKAIQACCDAVTRGVAIKGDALVMATLDGRLIKINRHSGKVLWSISTIPENSPYTITGSPRIGKDLVFIGNGGAEMGARGYVSAYKLATGKLSWRFYTIPGNPDEPIENPALAKAMPTWTGRWWELGGGGTVWDAIVYDEELHQLYIGVGNGGPHNPAIRSPQGGDNLYLSSIVALAPETGEYLWHYQQTPGDAWDYTATQPMILADIKFENTIRKVILQAPKNGFFYVLDREKGGLIYAKPFADLNWAQGIDEIGRPIIHPRARYYEYKDPVLIMPGPAGAHSWQPMAYHPKEQSVFIPVSHVPFVFNSSRPSGEIKGLESFTDNHERQTQRLQEEAARQLKGYLLAWDPVEQQEKWRFQMPSPVNGGVIVNAGGLVFAGGGNGEIYAFDSVSGQPLWVDQTYGGILAAPTLYEAQGETYLTVLQGWGGGFSLLAGNLAQLSGEKRSINRIVTYKLGGKDLLIPPAMVSKLPLTSIDMPEGDVAMGRITYAKECRRCHGGDAISGGTLPDLRHSPIVLSKEGFDVVLKGALLARGMPSFANRLSSTERNNLRAYILNEAKTDTNLAVTTSILENMQTVMAPLSKNMGALITKLDREQLNTSEWQYLSTAADFMARSIDQVLKNDTVIVRLEGAKLASEFGEDVITEKNVAQKIHENTVGFTTHFRELQKTLNRLSNQAAQHHAENVVAESKRMRNQCSSCHTSFWE